MQTCYNVFQIDQCNSDDLSVRNTFTNFIKEAQILKCFQTPQKIHNLIMIFFVRVRKMMSSNEEMNKL